MGKVIHLFTVFTSPPRPPSATTVLIALKSFYCIRRKGAELKHISSFLCVSAPLRENKGLMGSIIIENIAKNLK